MSAQPQPNQQRQQPAPDLSPISPHTIKALAPGNASNSPSHPQASQAPAAGPNQYTTPHPPLSQPLSTGEIPIAATPFAAPYLPRLFSEFTNLTPSLPFPLPLDRHFEHLACSYTSHPHAPAPTMEQLKQHAQALCLLITTLSACTEALDAQNRPGHPASEVLDFLPRLLEPYHSPSPSGSTEEKLPLESLRNTVAMDVDLHEHWPSGPASRLLGCPALPEHVDREGLPRFMWHANQILEIIDGVLEGEGGLLGALPVGGGRGDGEKGERNEEERKLAEESLFGQWLVYTQDLVLRVAELEREVVGLRELCAGAMAVPSVAQRPDNRGSGSGDGSGSGTRETETEEQEQITEKERYILAGLTPSLWTRLQSALSASEQLSVTREQRAYRRGFTAQGLLESLPHPDSETESATNISHRPSSTRASQLDLDRELRDDSWVPDNIVAWIECSSRIFRCQGDEERLFVVPAWDVRPGVEMVRKVEEGPLVVCVPVRKVGQSGRRGGRGDGGQGGGGDGGQGNQGGGGAGGEAGAGGAGPGAGGGGKAIDPYGKPIARVSEGGFRPTRGGAKTRPGAGRGAGKTRGGGAPAEDLSEYYRRKFEEQKRQCELLRDSHEQLRLKVEQLERAK